LGEGWNVAFDQHGTETESKPDRSGEKALVKIKESPVYEPEIPPSATTKFVIPNAGEGSS
jgi:hypothetical protein